MFTRKTLKTLIIGMLSLSLTSCCTQPKEVLIPVATKQNSVKIPPKPVLPISKLKKGDTPDKVIKDYAASVEILQGYSNQLVDLLKAY